MKKATIFADPMLAMMAFTFLLIFDGIFGGSALGMLFFYSGPLKDNYMQAAYIFLVAMLVGDCLWVGMFPRMLVRFVFTEESVQIIIPFHKTVEKPYKAFPYIQLAGYYHCAAAIPAFGKWRAFLVLANRRLSRRESLAVNGIASSEELIKIRISRKNVERLCNIVPPNMCNTIRVLCRPLIDSPSHNKRPS